MFGGLCGFICAFLWVHPHPHLHGGDSLRYMVDNKVPHTHTHTHSTETWFMVTRSVFTEVICNRNLSWALMLVIFFFLVCLFCLFVYATLSFHSLNPSLHFALFLSCPVFIPCSSATHSHIPPMSSQLLLYLTNIADIPPLLYHLSQTATRKMVMKEGRGGQLGAIKSWLSECSSDLILSGASTVQYHHQLELNITG